MISQPLANALTASPIPNLPEEFESLTYRAQTSTAESQTPFLVVIDTGVENITRNSLRKVMWEIRLITDPDATVPESAPQVLQALERHLRSEALVTALIAALPAGQKLVHWWVAGLPPMVIDDRIIMDTVTGTARIGLEAVGD